ncbi:MAG TPA: amino acid adenylation domain-containing protein [Blastocatellia bacterium]|nr:amino acid adenylation domain-containing protein [Blastocatellia bacterium]
MIGCFVNTLALRVKLDGDPAWRELLHRVREVTLGAYAHQDLAFEKLVQELRPERDMSRSPLFQVMLVLQNAPHDGFQLRGLKMKGIRVEDTTAEFELTLVLFERKEGLYVSIEYNKGLFEASTMKRMAQHFEQVLTSLVRDPARRISSAGVLTEQERQQITAEWNSFETAGGPETVTDLFEAQMKRSPDALAVVSEGGSLSYAGLNRRSNSLASYLRGAGVTQNDIVGLCIERSPEMLIGLFGILKAGGAYVPLDPKYPRERLTYMLRDSAAPLVVTQQNLVDLFANGACRTVCLDSDWPAIALEPDDALNQETLPESIAYVIYTSGTTGLPKGVQISHQSLSNYAQAFVTDYAVDAADRVLQFASLSFDTSAEEIYPALIAGAALVLRTDSLLGSSVEFINEIARLEITILDLPTAFWHTFTDAIRSSHRVEWLPRVVIIGGERALGEAVYEWRRQFGDRGRLVNTYGPTESTIVALRCDLSGSASALLNGGHVPIGRPTRGLQAYILGNASVLTPVGVIGEISIGGAGLARGYLNGPDLTAARFAPNEFAGHAGSRIYRTGDLGRYREDGNIEYIGRTDHQVKIRGHRVELAEIETVLRQYWEVREAVVTAREDEPGQTYVVAYIVGEEGVDPSSAEIQAYLKDRLPAYMAPAFFVILDKLPVTASGKIDRAALPAPEVTGSDSTDVFMPRTPIEEVICNIWSGVLRVRNIGVRDNFFDVGGHSLLATQAISRMREAFGAEVAVRQLFENPTPEALASIIEQKLRDRQSLSVPPILPADRSRPLPPSFAQQRLWFIEQLRPDTPAYNMARAIRLSGDLDLDHLNHAFTEIIRRHESLRTRFPEVDGQIVQWISPAAPFRVREASLPDWPEDENARIAAFVEAEVRRPCNLSEGPLFRATLAPLARGEHVLVMVLHHIISDGWSMGIFFAELNTLYRVYTRGDRSPLTDLRVQYADYTVWQREWLTEARLNEQLAYWRGNLAGAPALLDLPTDRPRQQLQTYRAGYRTMAFSAALTDSLMAVSKREGVTLFMTLLAAFEVLLSRYSGQDDIVVGAPIAGRSRAELEGVIGLFVNTLPLRINLSGEPSFREALKRTREVCLGAYAHQDAPFEKMVEQLAPERTTSHTPLFQVVFALQNAPWQNVDLSGLRMSGLNASNGAANYDLSFSLVEEGSGGIQGAGGWVEYRADIFDAETVSRFVSHYINLLTEAAAAPDQSVIGLPLLSAAETNQIVRSWNQTACPYPRDNTVVELFEQQVEATPEAVALVAGSRTFTYSELNSRANRVARCLVQHGVQVESMVGILMDRSVEMVLAFLATLKAGGVYVPLDPQYPKTRLTFMIEDADVNVVVTNGSHGRILADSQIEQLSLDQIRQEIDGEAPDNQESHTVAGNLAYVIYTSGSTGAPKGVTVSHRNIIRLVKEVDYVKLDGNHTLLQASSMMFDAATFEIWGALLNGGKCVLVEQRVPTAKELESIILEQRVTAAFLTTSLFNAVVDAGPERLRGLKELLVGGETLSVQHVERALGAFDDTVLSNIYGPTEGTTFTCLDPIDGDSIRKTGNIPIGRPIANTEMYVLDQRLSVIPVGVRGELLVGGDGVARGYLKRPELTAERFIPDSYGKRAGARLYRSGDVAAHLPDGRVNYVGRKDHQLKLRGYRVELGEIESALRECEGIRDAVVVVKEDSGGDKRLIAYVVALDQSKEPEASALQSGLKEKLPTYMVPSVYVPINAVPLTPNGKVDKDALPVAGESETIRGEYEAPRTPVEETICHAWSEILGVQRIGIHDNFFDLGGHSLMATRVITRIRGLLGVELPLRVMFESPTVSGVAMAVVQAKAEEAEGDLLERLLAELEELPQDEVQRILEEEMRD